MTDPVRLAEAMLFAATVPVTARALGQALPDGADADAVLAELAARYAGRGVELVEVAGGWQFRTAPDLGAALRKVVSVPRRLSRPAMEVLAVVAYHQPCTRAEIEAMRGVAVSQDVMDALLGADLIASLGQRQVAGRPTEWGTTRAFLTQFGLGTLADLPPVREFMIEAPPPAAVPSPGHPC